MSESERPPTDEEMREAYEAELKRVRVEDVLVQTVVSLINLGGRKAGLVPGSEDERDAEQLRMAVDGVRALMPMVEPVLGPDGEQVRQALSQLQMAFAQQAGGQQPTPGAGGPPPPVPPRPEPPAPEPPPSRLWVPGQ